MNEWKGGEPRNAMPPRSAHAKEQVMSKIKPPAHTNAATKPAQVGSPALEAAPATASSTAMEHQKRLLEIQKLELEAQKIRQETQNLTESRKWYWSSVRSIKLTEWLTAGAALGLVLAGWYTGLFNAVRERIEIEKVKLGIEKLRLEEEKTRLVGEVRTKEDELAQANKRYEPVAQEEAALQELRSAQQAGLSVSFSTLPDYSGLKVSITHNRPNWGFLPDPQRQAGVGKAIAAVNRLRSVKGIRIQELLLSPDEVALITARDDVESLVIEHANIDQSALGGVRVPKSLKRLGLGYNRIVSFDGVPTMDSVTALDLSRNPLGREGLERIATVFPKLWSLNLSNSNAPESAVPHIEKLRELSSLNICGTRIGSDGIKKLSEMPNLSSLSFKQDQLTPEAAAVIRKLKPNLLTADPPPVFRFHDEW